MEYSKFGIISTVTSTGMIIANSSVISDKQVKIITTNAGASNTVVLRGQIQGQTSFDVIGTVTGSVEQVFDVSLFDSLQIECTVFSPTSGPSFNIVASGFDVVAAGSGGGGGGNVTVTNFPSVQTISGTVTANLGTIDGAATAANQATEITALGTLHTDNSSVISSLGTISSNTNGVSTAANQVTSNTSLASIDSKLTSPLSTKITNGTTSVDVINLGTQVTTSNNALVTNSVIHGLSSAGGGQYVDVKVNPSGTLQVDGSSVTQPISGSITANAGTNLNTSALALESGGNLAGINTKITTTANGIKIDGSAVTQPISGSVTANLGTLNGAATSALQTQISGQLPATLGAKTTANSMAVNIASDQTVPVSSTTLALESGGNLAAMNAKLPASNTTLPNRTDAAQPTIAKGQQLYKPNFNNVVASGVDSTYWSTPIIGSGMTVSQSSGTLIITSGTTANDETIIRSNQSFKGNLELKWANFLSQRIINQTFYIELVDVIGDSLSYTINSATSVTVTIPSNPFTSSNVGQSMTMQNITGTAGTIPGRYAIASVSGNNVTFTVAGFPASGTGTMSLVGWNYAKAYYNGGTTTSVVFETQRKGYNTNSSLTATTQPTSAPGVSATISIEDGQIVLQDQVVAASTSLSYTRRGETTQSLPDETTPLFLQIHLLNGSTAPASTTTWTLNSASIANRVLQNVAINSVSTLSQANNLPVNVSGGVLGLSTTSVTIGYTALGAIQSNDQASSAITTTTTGATKSIGASAGGQSIAFSVNISAVGGTTPTYDFKVQESPDGTVWTDIWAAPRLTTTGTITTPALRIRGANYRYVETLSGTSPSFTRTITSGRLSHAGELIRNIIDRTIAPITTNSVTPTLYCEGASFITLTIAQGAGGSAVQFAIDGSMDGTNWIQGIKTVTGVVSGFTQGNVSASFKYIRARVVTGVASTTINYVELEAKEMPVDVSLNQNGSSSGTIVLTGASATTISPPAGAIGFILQNDQVSTVNIRFRTSGTVTTSSGFQLTPGQSTGYIPGAPTLSLIAVSGTTSASYNLEWILK
jgi:hypothetical protein